MRRMRGLEDARKALASGERHILSEPFAACFAGVNYYSAMLTQLRSEYGDFDFTLCCGEDAAIAHDALRMGFTHIVCDCGEKQFVELAYMAQSLGSSVSRPNGLDPVAKAAKPNAN